ncbi:MAG: hemerythrin domain-containing protein [Phycisphaerales bacterium]|nr:hemerythrin domain-containing protein [Phycisphaerales bacterium]
MSNATHESKTGAELAARMREEHGKVDELATVLSERVAHVPRANQQRWIESAREAFEHFRAHMHRHIAMEERDGYMSAVVEIRPRLSDEVERLKREHRQILKLLNAVHDLCEDVEPADSLIIRDVCHRVQDILRYVEHHNQSENVLVISAFSEDIGTHD